ncbi:MAG: 4-(cytidine 5'-diphospho)-2-C-methyl-D-erythritol kinase [Candidatus Omnitrophota bacterium]
MKKLVLRSPAKVNLYLNILRKRADGYHDIETIFEKIALFDRITLRPADRGITITTSDPRLPRDAGNLAYRAAQALFDATGYDRGVTIDILKNIPVGGGMGGGSSNAAAVLSGLNRFFKLGVSRQELLAIGATLGADVPFFLYHESIAIGTGKGECLTPIKSNICIWHIIVSFEFGISTKKAYTDRNLTLTPKLVDATMCLRYIEKKSIADLASCLYNKLEEVVLTKESGIPGSIKRALLSAGAYGALLSGSGSTVFGITKTREEAIAVRDRLLKYLSAQRPFASCKGVNPWRIGKVLAVKTFTRQA